MKKRIILVIVIVLMSFSIGFVVYKNINNERKETIVLVKKIFGINIQDFEFEYQNTLKRNKNEGSLTVKLIVNADQLEEFLNKWEFKAGFKFSTWPDDSDYITVASNRLGIDAREKGELYSKISGIKRKIMTASKHNSVMSFVYFLENDDSSTTIYMNYAE